MPTAYNVVLRLALQHQYFTDGVLRTLAIVPTPASAERLRRAGWLLKAQADGFALLAPDRPAGPTPTLTGKALPFPLQFALQPQEANFCSYTDLPLTPDTGQPGHWLTYCFNLTSGKAKSRQVSLPAKPTSQLPLRPLKFDYTFSDNKETELWAVPAGEKPLCRYAAGSRRASIDVSYTGSGLYELRSSGSPFRFYADDYLAATRPWGILLLTAHALAAAPGICYTLRFAARAVYWQYQIRGPLPPAPAILTTEGAKAPLKFRLVPPVAGSSACFQSLKPIRLAQCYSLAPLKLFARYPSSAPGQKMRPISLPLPFGRPEGLKKIKVKNSACYATEIFVTLHA